MLKTLKKYNSFQFYIREKFKPIWIEFIRLIKEDNNFINQRVKDNAGLISIAILTLIYNYVMSKNPDFQIQNETSNQNNSEEAKTN